MCPDTIITFTCSDTLVFGMGWSALPLLNEDNSPALGSDIEIGDPFTVEGVFTITLVSRELMMSSFRGNYTSTLDVVVNDRIGNGTTVTCFTPSTMASLIIEKQGCCMHWRVCSRNFMGFVRPTVFTLHTGLPLRPNVEFNIASDSVEHFTVCLTWQRQESDLYYLINTITGMEYTQTTTGLCLTAEYNTPLLVSVVAVNCAGESEPGTTNITRGLAMFDSCLT